MAKTELPGDVLLQCENVSLGYEGHALLTGLDLTIRQGDSLCVVGENGSGKSGLMMKTTRSKPARMASWMEYSIRISPPGPMPSTCLLPP